MNRASQPSLALLLCILVTLAALVLTIGYDIALLRLVKIWKRERIPSSRMDNIEDRHIIHEPPMRNTIINMLSIINVFSVGILMRDNEVTYTSKYQSIFTAVLSAMVLKSPFIIFWTLKVNESNERRDQEEERERMRQIEIKRAKMRMAQLRTRSCQGSNEVEVREVKEVKISIDEGYGSSRSSTKISETKSNLQSNAGAWKSGVTKNILRDVMKSKTIENEEEDVFIEKHDKEKNDVIKKNKAIKKNTSNDVIVYFTILKDLMNKNDVTNQSYVTTNDDVTPTY